MENTRKYDPESAISFFDQPQVEIDSIPVGDGVQLGIERVFHPEIGIGGAYGTWGESYDNQKLIGFLEHHLGGTFPEENRMDLSSLGFAHRHHVSNLSPEENLETRSRQGMWLDARGGRRCFYRYDGPRRR